MGDLPSDVCTCKYRDTFDHQDEDLTLQFMAIYRFSCGKL